MKLTARTLVLTMLAVAVALLAVPAADATFPGRNGDIAFSRQVDDRTDIWVVDPGTGQETKLTNTVRPRESFPDWNADGTRIAYSRCGRNEFSNCEIWVMNADGTGKERLTHTGAQETWPSWSPDGAKIAYTSNADDDLQDIYVMDADGTNHVRLTTTIGFDAFPEWSPDGTKIVFTSARSAPDDIWVMDADGSDQTRLTTGRAIDERPDWSPDGTLITFSRNGNIWTIGPDGADPVKLTANRWFEFGPTFSPNGRRITYDRQGADGRIGVWIMRADGSHARRRTNGDLDFFPDWQPA